MRRASDGAQKPQGLLETGGGGGGGGWGGGSMEADREGDYVPTATLSPPE